MKLVLPGKDLLVIGFWTDWGYLNDVLAKALTAGGFNSVTVVDPTCSAALQTKAPALWKNLTNGTTHFQHIQASGSDALAELQIAFFTPLQSHCRRPKVSFTLLSIRICRSKSYTTCAEMLKERHTIRPLAQSNLPFMRLRRHSYRHYCFKRMLYDRARGLRTTASMSESFKEQSKT
jgi:hypothetical protein